MDPSDEHADICPEAEELFFAGVCLTESGDVAGAQDAYRKALAISPDFAEAHANLGLLLERNAQFDAAEHHQRRAVEINPQQPQFLINLGALLIRLKRFDEAELICRQALLQAPLSASAWTNLGVLQTCTFQDAEAEQCHRTAIALDAENLSAPTNLAHLLLRQGRYEEGWRYYEQRKTYEQLERLFTFPRWQGDPLHGKKLLIGIEMGHGDMIQFSRYARIAKEHGASRVGILCHPGLKRLFESLAGVDEIIAANETVPREGWDYWTPPMSFPYFFKTRLDSIPAQIPYLSAKPDQIRRWAQAIGSEEKGKRIGIVWRGNPRFENDADRSIHDMALLASLGDIAGTRFFNLQKGLTADEANELSTHLPCDDLGPQLDDFADTAAVVENLDLVITVDSAVAHLAGALERPCWVLLPAFKTDWRWLLNRDDSPWYPAGMRLFRQDKPGDWATVLGKVRKALEGLVTAN
ncbi:tetratricopeptide repeat protein [Propionivibrio limicola]|uniref:tetratricopeptide repeat-containing glycosyltransferase family protein n=1 Tax=Propionivibrio limicola TaxID=167645 RepID=UPI0012918A25|nr:tetratricopeptide repeat protein [Propionivibrio limicola]